MTAIQDPSGGVSFTFSIRPMKSSPASPMGLFGKLPVELRSHLFGYIYPSSVQIKVNRRQRTVTNNWDPCYISTEESGRKSWNTFNELSQTSKPMHVELTDHKRDAQIANRLNLVMDMTTHFNSPATLINNSRPQSPYFMKFLNSFTRLTLSTVITLYALAPKKDDDHDSFWDDSDDSDDSADSEDEPEYERIVEGVTMTIDLFAASQPQETSMADHDNIISLVSHNTYSNVSPTSVSSFLAALQAFQDGLYDPSSAQSSLRMPYLPEVNSRGLYDLGVLITTLAPRLVNVPQNVVTGGVQVRAHTHTSSMGWLGWVEDHAELETEWEQVERVKVEAENVKKAKLAKQVADAVEAAKSMVEKEDEYTDEE
ncbi:hypothetical protein TI39_contig4202g00056 [Zymoseptoria brevis]|uniref:Uncharacterized protein n=1 Tax=Zymoseptoria brevis TaxID=1047168 RepID=A0A0F4GBF1_9PEZI|nr:hypothetical protein TI39_contig4202g00056 [Zymoseptoria brevis]